MSQGSHARLANRQLRIGINALYLIPGGVGGTEIYLRNLLTSLAAIDGKSQYLVFMNRETGDDLVPAASNFTSVRLLVPARIRPARILWEQTALPLALRRRRVDVLLNPGFTAPAAAPCPMVTVFHDLQHLRHPEYFRWFDLPFWRWLLWLAVQRSQYLIAVSEATRQDLLRFYRVAPERAVTALSGVNEAFFGLRAGRKPLDVEDAPYLFCVSTLHPHKNLDALLRAFTRFHQECPSYRLVIAGLRGFFFTALERLRVQSPAAAAIRFTGWVPDEELRRFYANADAFLYPSRFEGFGLPVLEAMAAGLPTACSDIEPLRSIAGDAALLFDPLRDDAILEAMERITSDAPLRLRLQTRGPQRASEFSWKRTAATVLQVLQKAAGREETEVCGCALT